MTKSNSTKHQKPISPNARRVSRARAEAILDCSTGHLRRLELRGVLSPIRDVEGGKVFYALAEIEALTGAPSSVA